MAQLPKGWLVRGPDKPIHGSCAIYFPGGIVRRMFSWQVVIVLGSLLLDFDLRKGRVAIEITLAAMVLLGDILLMDEILHQLIGSLSHYLQGFIHTRRCRISSINSRFLKMLHLLLISSLKVYIFSDRVLLVHPNYRRICFHQYEWSHVFFT